MMEPEPVRPPFDAEVEPALANLPGYFTTLEPPAIPDFRAATTRHPSLDEIGAGRVPLARRRHGGREPLVDAADARRVGARVRGRRRCRGVPAGTRVPRS